MKICGQTLILVDNDSTVSEVNQKIIKSTLKYMFYHTPENRAYCLQNYTHALEEDEVYTTEINDLLCKADTMEFSAKDSNLNDCLASVLTSWKESDFACRDIVVFTDGMESVGTDYEKEELYYLLENTKYPVYVVYLVQDDNSAAKKQLSAIATLSEGELFETVYPGDDAGVDRFISEGIFSEMESYASLNWVEYEDGITETDRVNGIVEPAENGDLSVNDKEPEDEEYRVEQTEENNLYQYDSNDDALMDSDVIVLDNSDGMDNLYTKPGTLLMGFALLAAVVIAAIISGMIIAKRRRDKAREVNEIRSLTSKNTRKEDFFEDIVFDNYGYDESTDEECYATRIIRESSTVLLTEDFIHGIELSDSEDGSNIYKIEFKDHILVGRSQSDSDFIIKDDSVSKKHCEFSYEGGYYYICDLDSSNGTFVNGERIGKLRIDTGDNIKIGRVTYKVRCI